jgi:hypothetical protein
MILRIIELILMGLFGPITLLTSLSQKIKKTLEEERSPYSYRKKLEKDFFPGESNKTIDEIVSRITNRLQSPTTADNFRDTIHKIDSSRYTRDLIQELRLSYYQEYGKMVFLPAQNVISLQIIKLEPLYQIKSILSISAAKFPMIIPESAEVSDLEPE